MAHVQNGISCSCKSKGNYRIYRQMDGNGNYGQWMNTKSKETDSSRSFYFVEQSFEFLHLCVWFRVSIETRKLESGHLVAGRGLILGESDNRTHVNMYEMTVERENTGSGKV